MRDELLASVYAPPKTKEPWRLEDRLPGYDLRYFSYGRRALAAGLAAAGVKPGDTVLLPEFICRDLLSSLAAVHAVPAYYPVGPDLAPSQDPSLWPQARAVVAVDYFGFPQDLAPFQAYCERTGAALIEDNAHGLFSRDEAGLPLGARADIGIFSLRKSLALPDGAALALKTGAREWAVPAQSPFRSRITLRQRSRGLLRALAGSLGAPTAFTLLRAFRALRGVLRGNAPSGGPDAET
ncbi:MAG: DegT/DnrJ/EryC1/StrS family aminotransferase, partial [Elusimicrobiota bacterium]